MAAMEASRGQKTALASTSKSAGITFNQLKKCRSIASSPLGSVLVKQLKMKKLFQRLYRSAE